MGLPTKNRLLPRPCLSCQTGFLLVFWAEAGSHAANDEDCPNVETGASWLQPRTLAITPLHGSQNEEIQCSTRVSEVVLILTLNLRP